MLTTEAAEQIFKRARDRVFSTRLNGEDCDDVETPYKAVIIIKTITTTFPKTKILRLKMKIKKVIMK